MIESNYERNRRERFLEALAKFLKRQTEWRGTPTELADGVWEAAEGMRFRDTLPMGKGIRRELAAYRPYIEKRGWTWTEGRTAHSRWIELRRVKK